MLKIGNHNTLRVIRIESFGVYLISDMEEILLPRKYVPADTAVGDKIRVFVYKDTEDRTIATTLTPKAQVGEFAFLRVKDVSGFGAFLDWGLEKDLLVPAKQQPDPMIRGNFYVIRLYLDYETQRIAASADIAEFLRNKPMGLKQGDRVGLLVYGRTDLGYRVIVNNAFDAVLYYRDISETLQTGDQRTAYIKDISEDGPLVVTLQKIIFKIPRKDAPGVDVPGVDVPEKFKARTLYDQKIQIIRTLKNAGGFLPLHDKSSPDEIYRTFQISKKTFKQIIGRFYREKKITITKDGIRLLDKKK
ncbi:MAG: GntR family transcriptional regulator [Deltaproteobacteria bacterium]|nr:GntR family transcriptional regulator [Deltaproteobacteria bacterium]